MLFSHLTFISLLALAAPSMAGRAYVTNTCNSSIWVCVTRSCAGCSATCTQIAARGLWSEPYQGTGNSIGVTRNPNYYSPNTAKVILGYSDSGGRVYYSLNTVDGNPFKRFQLDPSDVHNCASLNDGSLRTTKDCEDAADINLSVYC